MSDQVQSQELTETERKFWPYMGWALLPIVLIAALMTLMAHLGILYHLEMFGLDPLLRSNLYTDPDLCIVEITDEDYKTYFHETSPLDRSKLRQLIGAIAAAKPRLLVVDLDVTPTKAEQDAHVQPLPTQVESDLAKDAPVIVWPITAERPSRNTAELRLSPFPEGIQINHLGVPLFPRERDGLVRGYMHYIPAVFKEARLWPTLPWQAVRGGTALDEPLHEAEKEEEIYFNFSGDRYAFDHTDVASVMQNAHSGLKRSLERKTVILGGNFAAARDEYFTPIGPVPGVDLTAYAIETELRGGGMRPLQEVASLFVDIGLGCLVAVVAFTTQSAIRRISASLCLAVILPFVGSYLVFHSWNLWLSFVPVIIGALSHIGLDHFLEARKEIRKLRGELKRCERPFTVLQNVETTTTTVESSSSLSIKTAGQQH